MEDERGWVASVIAQGTLSWIESVNKIQKKDLTAGGQYWLSFVCTHLQPSKNETDISIEKAILIASIMSGFKVDVGKIIFHEIGIHANQEQTSLPFPCLITTM